MNDLQTKTLNYLLSGGGTTSDRVNALRELNGLGFFDDGGGKESALVDYVDNVSFACDAGKQRFREAVGIAPPKPKVTTVRIVLDVIVENDACGITLEGSRDGGVAADAVAILNAESGKFRKKVVKADWFDYQAIPGEIPARVGFGTGVVINADGSFKNI